MDIFHWNLDCAISLMANSLILNAAYYYMFRNLTMIAYTCTCIIEIQKSKFTNTQFREFEQSEPSR